MNRDHRRIAGELGALLLDAGVAVNDVRNALVTVADTALDEHRLEFAVLPEIVLVTARDTGDVTVIAAHGSELSFRQAAAASRLVRQITRHELTFEAIMGRIASIRAARRPHENLYPIVGSALVACGLAIVFRCPWWSILVATIVGGLVGVISVVLGRAQNGAAIIPFLAAFVSTAAVGATVSVLDLGAVPLFGVCAPIAILVPGALITNSLLELTATDIVTGASRLVYGLMMLAFMSIGIIAGTKVTGMRLDHGSAALVGEIRSVTGTGGWHALPAFALSWVGVALLAVGIGFAFGAGAKLTGLSVAVMLATYSVVTLATTWVGNVAATGIGAAILFVIARGVERLPLAVPATVTFQPAFLLLVPGTVGLVALASLDTEAVSTIAETFVSLCIGTKVGALAAEIRWRRTDPIDSSFP